MEPLQGIGENITLRKQRSRDNGGNDKRDVIDARPGDSHRKNNKSMEHNTHTVMKRSVNFYLAKLYFPLLSNFW